MGDAWIEKNTLISFESAHAVGITVLYWNFVEDGIRAILTDYSGMTEEDAIRFTWDLGVQAMADTLLSFLAYKEDDPVVRDAIEHGLRMADICRQNRNVLAHGWINSAGNKIFNQKRGRSKMLTQVYKFDVETLRRVADEMIDCGRYFFVLALHLGSRGKRAWTQQPLPDKPLLPQILMSIDRYGPEVLRRPLPSSQE